MYARSAQGKRLLGALELTVERLNLTDAPDPGVTLEPPRLSIFERLPGWIPKPGPHRSDDTEPTVPGTVDYVVSQILQVASHPLTAETLIVPASLSEESEIVAAHGRAYLALAVARGRDDTEDDEGYELMVWAAPARVDRPEHAYRWVRRGQLSDAATVTVVTDSTVEDVLRAFGADPARPESIRANLTERMSIDPWVAVLDTGDAVLAVEYNGWQGSEAAVLSRAATAGRAASMFWNVNAMTRLSFAEQGRILSAFELMPGQIDAEPALAAALADLDFNDYRDKVGKGLVAVERFTGYGVTSDILARIETADIGFRIVP